MINISVVVPVYNAYKIIEKCLNAIKNQQDIDMSRLEIIVIDDASTDSSAAKARPLCDKFIHLQNNSGAATSRNTGVRVASGDIIVFVDGDVILEPYSLSQFINVFEKDKIIAAAVGRYSEEPVVKNFFNIYHNAFTRYHHDLSSQELNWFWGALSAVKKEALMDVGGFDERYQGASGEDLALGKMLSDKGYRIAYVPAAQGAHAHHFTILSMMKNDYLKAVIGMKMKLARLLPRQAPGFVNLRSIMTSFLLLLTPGLLLLNSATHIPFLAGIIFLILSILMIINRPYYAYLNKMCYFKCKLIIPFIHWIQMYTMIAGAVMGVLGYLLGRTAFGRPKWI